MIRLSLTAKLLVSFAVVIVLGALSGVVALYNFAIQNDLTTTLYTRDLSAVRQVEDARLAAAAYSLSSAQLIHTPDPVERERQQALRRDAAAALTQALTSLQSVALTPEGRDLLDQAATAWAQYTPVSDQVVVLTYSGRTEEADRLNRTTALERQNAVDAALRKLTDQQEQLVADSVRTAEQTFQSVRLITIAILLLVVLAGGRIVLIVRQLTREIRGGAQSLAAATGQIVASVTVQGASTSQQAAAISQTTATVDEVRVTAQHSSQKAQAVAAMAQRAAEVAAQGLTTVETTVAGMQDIHARVESIADQILALSEQTQQIGEIIAAVDDLADQSNLLAVNAAIEASRAGEQGRGFAVVAQEVRSLAERSKAATVQVRTILTDIQRATNAAVLATEQGTKGAEAGEKQVVQAGHAIRELAATIRESAEAAQQIVASVGQQSGGMDQIAVAMTSINQAMTETAAGTRQLQRAAANIDNLAQRLTGLVGRDPLDGRA